MRILPIALTIAGSDSGGGAGIQADLKTFAALQTHGASVVTCLTAQSPKQVSGVLPVPADFVRTQLEAVFSALPPRAAKTGMLYSAEVIETVHEFWLELKRSKRPPLVVDPVMVATSGGNLISDGAMNPLVNLFQIAALITPNLDETQALCGRHLRTPEDLRGAARWLYREFGCAVLVKGGHLRGARQAVDFFYNGREELMLSAPFVRRVATHGTGCTYSAAITAALARGMKLTAAVAHAKDFITHAIRRSRQIASAQALGWF